MRRQTLAVWSGLILVVLFSTCVSASLAGAASGPVHASSFSRTTSSLAGVRQIAEHASRSFVFAGRPGQVTLTDRISLSCSLLHLKASATDAGTSLVEYGSPGAQPHAVRLVETFKATGLQAGVSFPLGVGISTSGGTLTHTTVVSHGVRAGFDYTQSPLNFSGASLLSISHSAAVEIESGGIWTMVAQTSWHRRLGVC